MGIWDVEEHEGIQEDFVEETSENNIYLADPKQALQLVSKIIPISKEINKKKNIIKQLDDAISIDLLQAFRKVQLEKEAQLQVKLVSFGNKLSEQQKYSVLKKKVVVGIGGKFSAGKSKFINSLLKAEEELLPEDQNPTTSIPTYIIYGDKEEICAFTPYNGKVQLDVNALQALTHKFYDKYKMGFSSFISNLVLEEPKMPYQNLVFLDTPGYSKADYYNNEGTLQRSISDEKKAYEQLRNVDYLIWLVDIENGTLNETDVEFISKLNLENPILIVANKADKKIDNEIKDVVKNIEDVAISSGLNLFAVTAYSSRDNVEWKKAGKINEFLESAMHKKRDNDDVLLQISEIKRQILHEIEENYFNKQEERNRLGKVIFKSNDIFEIKALVEVYGETITFLNDLKKCESAYKKSSYDIEKLIKKYAQGR